MADETSNSPNQEPTLDRLGSDERCRLNQTVEQLVDTLWQMLEQHTRLLALVQQKKEAMRTGDAQAMSSLCQLENQTVQQIAAMEKQRLSLNATLTKVLVPKATEPLGLRELADYMAEPERSNVSDIRRRLREKMEQVKAESSVARRAAQALAQHMTGMVRTIDSISTGVSSYGQRGVPPKASAALRTISLQA